MEGFTAVNFLADKSRGKLIGIAFWDSESALTASDETVIPIQTAVADAMGGQVVGVESFELVAQSW
jgi:hypothetical protein